MRTAPWLALCLLVACLRTTAAQAQVPHIVGTWKLNAEASRLPGPAPQTEVRSYRLDPDGVLIGVAVFVDASGRPGFLQFAAKPDGRDYPELDAGAAARYLVDGSAPPRTYAETVVDSRTVDWADKAEGRVIAQGRKWVSDDGNTLKFTVVSTPQTGEKREFLYVFDRTGP